ncbi:actin-related protein 2/3 complex subunit 5-B [Schistocerca americana]|uniref:Actin-related protein 2/3 complex subunit 5 n=1 Tax=Schistocerca gregaria TaxID=7010 RepID=A0A8E5NHS8_SCHGR|nr:actin-related protein 2/3 complex subunit 5-B [Schistocerca americana]XP_047117002.1 actin-related protein 2/3 complex subunit 5-B [Schistocerca piceifrons]XP_049787179.1 actin-related protein 2/3 complex subunit 5-B [Schistocerca cancellata]XP_049816669.1 actin-related protein 2/3 complex subunit 5-B [Schistocerca nitens]XP_049832436.1 actin-related protein 2/3 complex subunit 5-B [Schistocerca gregaria]QVD39547.1 Actin-related protein 2/3 complex subunit 5-like protein [Schistocerca grega
MAKNTSSSAFRKIDVDQYNEDNYREEEQVELQSTPIGPDEAEVGGLMNQGRYVDALKLVLKNAPLGSKNQQVKDNALNLTLRVLLSIKSSQIEEAVAALDRDLIDVLMKYVYRGFEMPSEGSSGHLLLWHEKAYAVGGVGSIMRVLSDTKRA